MMINVYDLNSQNKAMTYYKTIKLYDYKIIIE